MKLNKITSRVTLIFILICLISSGIQSISLEKLDERSKDVWDAIELDPKMIKEIIYNVKELEKETKENAITRIVFGTNKELLKVLEESVQKFTQTTTKLENTDKVETNKAYSTNDLILLNADDKVKTIYFINYEKFLEKLSKNDEKAEYKLKELLEVKEGNLPKAAMYLAKLTKYIVEFKPEYSQEDKNKVKYVDKNGPKAKSDNYQQALAKRNEYQEIYDGQQRQFAAYKEKIEKLENLTHEEDTKLKNLKKGLDLQEGKIKTQNDKMQKYLAQSLDPNNQIDRTQQQNYFPEYVILIKWNKSAFNTFNYKSLYTNGFLPNQDKIGHELHINYDHLKPLYDNPESIIKFKQLLEGENVDFKDNLQLTYVVADISENVRNFNNFYFAARAFLNPEEYITQKDINCFSPMAASETWNLKTWGCLGKCQKVFIKFAEVCLDLFSKQQKSEITRRMKKMRKIRKMKKIK